MKILGIHDGHNSGASILIDGKIICSISEERLSRTKNDLGYPKKSIDEVLKIAKIDPKSLTSICFSTNFMHTQDHLQNISGWYNVGIEEQRRDSLKDKAYLKTLFESRKQERIDEVVKHLGVSNSKIKFHEHHLCHAAAAYYGSHFKFDDKILVLTADGAGDGLCSTVSVGEKGKLSRIASTNRAASVGKIYSRVTYLLGLKPWEHEYKVMGLAPYGDKERSEKLIDVFEDLVSLNDSNKLEFSLNSQVETNYCYRYLREKLERARFDEIARAVQTYTENIISQWVENCIKETGITKIACGGGVFMNVKANQKISKIKTLEDIFVFPSCGDESLSLGACWQEYYLKNNKKVEIDNIYLGGEFNNIEIEKEIKSYKFNSKVDIQKHKNIELEVAKKLSQNNIVARFSGKMEWGARALGNRSILSNPSLWKNVEKINSMIKMRDFWMPFAPSIISEKKNVYLKNEKKLNSPYMMMAFDTKEIAHDKISAAVHPRDRSARAQIVTKKQNPKYYELIKSFEDITGIPAVLNTSFNLHGFPLVYRPLDALNVFNKSGLKHLAIGNFLISKL